MILGSILWIAIMLAICFGAFTVAPRTKKALYVAVASVQLLLLVFNYLGSALVGPLDLRPMLVLTPFTIACAVVWYFWKVKPRELADG